MILEIVVYIVVIIVIAVSISLFAEALTNLVKGFGSKGKRDLIVSVAAIGFSYYFYKECTGYFENGTNFDFKYQHFLLVGLFALGIVTGIRETTKSFKNVTEERTPESRETTTLEEDHPEKKDEIKSHVETSGD